MFKGSLNQIFWNATSILLLGLALPACSGSSVKPEMESQYVGKSGFFYIKPDEIIDLKSSEHVDRGNFDQCSQSQIKRLSEKYQQIWVEISESGRPFLLIYHGDTNEREKTLNDSFGAADSWGPTGDQLNRYGPLSPKADVCKYQVNVGSSASDLLFVNGLPKKIQRDKSWQQGEVDWIYPNGVAQTTHYHIVGHKITSVTKVKELTTWDR